MTRIIAQGYMLPCCQKQGYSSQIMDCLEAGIIKSYHVAVLDTSLLAVCLYEHKG
ncbi:MAG TPA: hypothetical protein H9671_07685 [Firmicutes bacterium]|nr:hypothetical protein [Bacillota bacterium]